MSVVTQLPPEMGGASGKVSKSFFCNQGKSNVKTRSHISIPKVPWLLFYERQPITDALLVSGTFRPDRIRSIADRFGVDGNMALENILYGIFLAVYLTSLRHSICSARLQQ